MGGWFISARRAIRGFITFGQVFGIVQSPIQSHRPLSKK